VEQFADLFFPQAMEDLNVPGAVFVLVHDGEIVCSVGYGHANVELQTPADPEHSLFRVASVAKLMTATGVLTLMDQGKVDVGDNANWHLGRIELPQYKDSPITIADLLTHTEGFEQNSVGGKTLDPKQLLTLEEFLLSRRPQVYRAPGEMVTYGNHASAVLGLLIEDVSEESYADYIGKQLFEPISMSSSTFAQPLPLDLQERRVQEYRFENGAYRPIDPSYSHMVPAGGMHATAHDLALYLAMIQNGGFVNGEQILSSEALGLITRSN